MSQIQILLSNIMSEVFLNIHVIFPRMHDSIIWSSVVNVSRSKYLPIIIIIIINHIFQMLDLESKI